MLIDTLMVILFLMVVAGIAVAAILGTQPSITKDSSSMVRLISRPAEKILDGGIGKRHHRTRDDTETVR